MCLACCSSLDHGHGCVERRTGAAYSDWSIWSCGVIDVCESPLGNDNMHPPVAVNNLSYPKIHDSSHSSDGLVLSQVEGAHGKVSRAVVGSGEGHVQAGHLVDLTRVGQC